MRHAKENETFLNINLRACKTWFIQLVQQTFIEIISSKLEPINQKFIWKQSILRERTAHRSDFNNIIPKRKWRDGEREYRAQKSGVVGVKVA